VRTYKHVNYLWDDEYAQQLAGDEVALLLYRSNILGSDLRITNYGGGNTSCKVMDKDPLTGEEVEVMWIKGSGGDIGTLKKSGLAALYVDRLRDLEKVYRGIEHEDEMVELFNHCIFDLASKAPSIDTPLHGFLPFKHIDHLHPDAAIAIAAAKDGLRKSFSTGPLVGLIGKNQASTLVFNCVNVLRKILVSVVSCWVPMVYLLGAIMPRIAISILWM